MLNATKAIVADLINENEISNIAIRVGRGETVLDELYFNSVNEDTLFDIASMTKILSTTMLMLMAVDRKLITLNTKVGNYFNVSTHYSNLRIIDLLTHTMGIGHKNLTQQGNSYDNIAEYILSLKDIAPATDVLYSCPAFILLGKIVEKIYGKRIDCLFNEMVAKPLNMRRTSYLPNRNDSNIVNSNISVQDIGIVNDYNSRFLGGISGNAGIFSCISDLTVFVKTMLRSGSPLLSEDTMDIASKNFTENMSAARGLGFRYVDNRYKQTGDLFPVGSIGHVGHTGTSVFFNRESGLYVIILSDATISITKKYGKEIYDKVKLIRQQIHNAIKKDLNL